MWELQTPWWEIVFRISVIYGALFLMLRLAGKRVISQLDPADLLALLLLSEAVSPALTDEDPSISAALLAAGTLVSICLLLLIAAYRSRRLASLLDGKPRPLIENGRLDEAVMRKERINVQDLYIGLRRNGVESIADVRLAVVEPNGDISVVEQSREQHRSNAPTGGVT